MEVRTCKLCKKIFNYAGGDPICEPCKRKLEDKFQEVRTYIDENPGSSMEMVAEECDVSTKIIKKWIREERLELKAGGGITIECESCGKPITTGRFCEECSNKMADELGKSIAKKKPEPVKKNTGDNKQRMRFLES